MGCIYLCYDSWFYPQAIYVRVFIITAGKKQQAKKIEKKFILHQFKN